MSHRFQKAAYIFLKTAKAVVVFFVGGIVVHMLVMLIDYYLMPAPFRPHLQHDFIVDIFSVPMIPMMGAYGGCLLAAFILWERMKKALLLAHDKETHKEQAVTALRTLQRITGLLAEHIAAKNAGILQWVETRKKKGRQPPETVVRSSRDIAAALHALAEVSFVYPYSHDFPGDIEGIEEALRHKLNENQSHAIVVLKSTL